MGALGGGALLLVPVALGIQQSVSATASASASFGPALGDILADGGAFAACILLWSIAAAAQGPALAAIGQQLAPKGSEATALALPRAIGDGVYVVAPATLGIVTDALSGTPGAGCAAAGVASALGAAALAVLLARDDANST